MSGVGHKTFPSRIGDRCSFYGCRQAAYRAELGLQGNRRVVPPLVFNEPGRIAVDVSGMVTSLVSGFHIS
jgi:hypothetical protein